jgi:hypothetical protein
MPSLPPNDPFTLQSIQAHILDADSEWWPFVFLRPEQHQRFTAGRCALLALLYGAPAALLGVVAGMLLGDTMQRQHLVLFPLGVAVLLFVGFMLGVAPSWNRRAARLRPLHERRTEWQRSVK